MQPKLHIRPSTYIYIVLLLLLIPFRWVLAWIFAAGFHELCHWLAVKLCGGEVCRITVGLGGAEMECSPMSGKKSLFAVLSGPAGGLFLLLFARWIPRTALFSLFLSVYNLLPLLPLDGGRALAILVGARAYKVQKLFLLVLSVGAVYATAVLGLGLLPVAIIIILWLKCRNNPCKPGACKVQ